LIVQSLNSRQIAVESLMSISAKGFVGLFLAGILAAFAGSAQATLIAHYALDSAASGVTPDSTGQNGDGTLFGTVTAGGTGIVGGAFQFLGGATGNVEYVSIADPTGGLGQVTASVWILPGTVGDLGPLARWISGATTASILIRTDGSGNVQEYVHGGTSGQIGGGFFPTQSVSTAAFSLLTLTFDGKTLVPYLNGEKASNSYSFGGSGITLGVGTGTVAIGGRGGSEKVFTGLIDDVSFFDEKLTDGEIRALFTLATHPVLNYDAGTASILFDVYDGDLTEAQYIGGYRWSKVPGGTLTGNLGDVVSLGGLEYGLILNAAGGGLVAAVPEPSTAALAGFALLTLAWHGRRRRRWMD
jgi:hypothetical protein